MERLKVTSNDSDNYSDEDFYSDEGESTKNQTEQEDDDRDDDGFAFDETVKKGQLGEVVNYYQQYLVRQDDDESGSFDDYSDSFKQQQVRVQNAYGEDTEIYKTLNPKHSQAQIKPVSERHQDSKNFIEQRLGSDLFRKLYEMLEIEVQDETDHKERWNKINEIVDGNQELVMYCRKLEEIIYLEQNFTYA